MSNSLILHEMLVAANKNLCHNVAIISEMFDLLLGTEVIKAVTREPGMVVLFLGVFVDGLVSLFCKLEGNLSAGFYFEI